MTQHRLLPILITTLSERRKTANATDPEVGKVRRIAASADVSESTIYGFERGAKNRTTWPDDTDEIVWAYAEALGIQPSEIWRDALERLANAPREAGDESPARIPPPPGLAPSRSTAQPQPKSPARKATARRGGQR